MYKDKLQEGIERIYQDLVKNKNLTNFDLLNICRNTGTGDHSDLMETNLPHELLEVAVNKLISKTFSKSDLQNTNEIKKILTELKHLEKQLPVKSWRTREQNLFQQFSTPPPVAFLMARLLNAGKGELVLEPSAGTGALAVWLKIFGCRQHVNELSATRRKLLEIQRFEPTAYNAEFIDDLLPVRITPDAVLMNPPFSSTAGRTRGNDSEFGFRHVNSSLSRLNLGGRMVVLLGTKSGVKSQKAQKFWSQIAAANELKGFIHLPGNAFYKYGTTIAASIVCITKGKPPQGVSWKEEKSRIQTVSCRTIEDCLEYINIF